MSRGRELTLRSNGCAVAGDDVVPGVVQDFVVGREVGLRIRCRSLTSPHARLEGECKMAARRSQQNPFAKRCGVSSIRACEESILA
jgi:hypothetical protein